MTDRDEIGRRRSELRQQFKDLYEKVTRILFEESFIMVSPPRPKYVEKQPRRDSQHARLDAVAERASAIDT